MAGARHAPVLLDEIVEHLAPMAGECLIDGTFGAGGYCRALLAAADIRLLAIERDPQALEMGAPLVAGMQGRLTLVAGRFGDLASIAAEHGFLPIQP